jgi:hypothetical protein
VTLGPYHPPGREADAEEWFRMRATFFMSWLRVAAEYRRAAIVLARAHEADRRALGRKIRAAPPWPSPPPDLSCPMLLAMGVAIENLLKGILSADPSFVVNGQLPRRIRSHALPRLYSDALGSPSATRHAVLDLLRIAVEGWARYPVGTSATQDSVQGVHYHTSQVWEEFEAMFRELALELCRRHIGGVALTRTAADGTTEPMVIEDYVDTLIANLSLDDPADR